MLQFSNLDCCHIHRIYGEPMAEDHVMRNEKRAHFVDTKGVGGISIKVDQQKKVKRKITM